MRAPRWAGWMVETLCWAATAASARSLVTMTHVSGDSVPSSAAIASSADATSPGSAIPLWHHGQRGSSLRRESPPSRSVADPAPPARSHTRTSPATRGPGAHAPPLGRAIGTRKGFPGAAASQHACHPASEPSPTGTPGRRCHAPAASPPSHPTRSWSPSRPTVSGPRGQQRPVEERRKQRPTSAAHRWPKLRQHRPRLP